MPEASIALRVQFTTFFFFFINFLKFADSEMLMEFKLKKKKKLDLKMRARPLISSWNCSAYFSTKKKLTN